jgi:hypothetical protein
VHNDRDQPVDLADALKRAAAETDDVQVVTWLRALAAGDAAEGTPTVGAQAERPRRRRAVRGR